MSGKKYDEGKVQLAVLFLQFPRALEAIAICSKYGNDKYENDNKDWRNFERVPDAEWRYKNAGLRHELAHSKGEYFDSESKLPHLYHKAWNALAELELHLKNVT